MMQKVTRFLEANVEWFALAVAMLFLGWTAYTYIFSNPASGTLDNTPVSPGNVDSFIDQHATQRLRDKMDPNATPPSFDVPDYKLLLQAKIGLDAVQPPELATDNFDYAPFDPAQLANPLTRSGPPVTQLPAVPTAQPLLVAAALNTIAPPQANGAAAPAALPVNAPAAGKDVRLVVAAFTIPWNDLYSQWNASFGPQKPGQPPRLTPADFQILQITAYRSELINDVWSKDEEIKILNGAGLPDYPAAGNKNAESAYSLAVSKTPKAVVAPDFPAVSAGAVWSDPIQFLTGAANQPAAPNPPDPNSNGAMIAPEPFPTVNTSEPLGGTLYAQAFGQRSGVLRRGPAPSRAGVPNPQVNQAPPPPSAIPLAPGTVTPVVKLANPGTVPNPLPVEPLQKLNVLALPAKSPDLGLYIIDDTVQAGKTYRYRISYKALNPLFNKPPQRVPKNNQNWVNQFDLESKISNYSPEIEVPKQTYFFCGKPQGAGQKPFPFEVFTWTGGKWLKSVFNAGLGDPIGGVDSGTDYSTGWTFVDLRPPTKNNKRLVTLVDNEGNVDIRDVSVDSTSADYKKATQWVEQTKNGAAGAPAVNAPPSPYGAPGPYGGYGRPPGAEGGPPLP